MRARTSSGSSDSPSAVEPVTSAKRMVTSFLSSGMCSLASCCHTFKKLCRLCRCRHFEQVLRSKVLGLWIAASSHLLRGYLCVVLCPAKFDPLRLEQQPVRAGTISVGHSYASRIENAHTACLQLKLHMGMPAHYNLRLNTTEDNVESFLRCDRRKDLYIVARGGVTEQYISQPINMKRDLLW